MAGNSSYDAVVSGGRVRDIEAKPVFVADETERNALGNLSPGQLAITYGMTAMWQWTGSAWETVFDRR